MRTVGTQHREVTRIHGDALVPRFLRGYLLNSASRHRE
jgi:hypothetical protein